MDPILEVDRGGFLYGTIGGKPADEYTAEEVIAHEADVEPEREELALLHDWMDIAMALEELKPPWRDVLHTQADLYPGDVEDLFIVFRLPSAVGRSKRRWEPAVLVPPESEINRALDQIRKQLSDADLDVGHTGRWTQAIEIVFPNVREAEEAIPMIQKIISSHWLIWPEVLRRQEMT
jgi:hypothetical protein